MSDLSQLTNEKLRRLLTGYFTETSPTVKFQLEHQIQQAYDDVKKFDVELDADNQKNMNAFLKSNIPTSENHDTQSSQTRPEPITPPTSVKEENKVPAAAPPAQQAKNNAWANGLFFLLVFVVVMATIAVIGMNVPAGILPIIIIGGLLAIGIIGAFLLRNDDRLSEKSFLTLIIETYKRMPLLRGGNKPKPDDDQ